MLKNTLIAAGLASLVLAAQPALAQSFDRSAPAGSEMTVQHRQVQYADLDLSTAAGQAKFDARLRRAASAVCEANYGPHPLSEALEARRCYRNALQAAQRMMADRGARHDSIKVAAR
jgi:UrcA family protein